MGPWGRKHGGLLLHVLVAAYTFLGLAIVCDEYFVASLDRICEGEFKQLFCAVFNMIKISCHFSSYCNNLLKLRYK